MFPRYEDLDKNTRLIWNLRDIGHVMRQIAEGKESQQRVLIVLFESGPVSQDALTEHLYIQPGSVSKVLGRLEELGLIERTVNEADKHTVLISLTENGTLDAKEAIHGRQKRLKEMFRVLSEEETDELLRLLEKISNDWNARFAEYITRRKHKE